MEENRSKPKDEIAGYSSLQTKENAEICDLLKREIEQALPGAASKLYHSAPVWFIDGIPIVGYNATPKYVNLLFWSGQSFDEPDLIASGKFKAAQIRYRNARDLRMELLRKWLEKSQRIIWNYKDLPKTGELVMYRKPV